MRTRMLKPGFFVNEELALLPFEYRLLYQGLWLVADRAGRLEDRPLKLKMILFPADNVDVHMGLSALENCGLIVRYVVNGMSLIQIPKFLSHQKPHQNEPASTLPEYEQGETSTIGASPSAIGASTRAVTGNQLPVTSNTPLRRVVEVLAKEATVLSLSKPSGSFQVFFDLWNAAATGTPVPNMEKIPAKGTERFRRIAKFLETRDIVNDAGQREKASVAMELFCADPWSRGDDPRHPKAFSVDTLCIHADRWIDEAAAKIQRTAVSSEPIEWDNQGMAETMEATRVKYGYGTS